MIYRYILLQYFIIKWHFYKTDLLRNKFNKMWVCMYECVCVGGVHVYECVYVCVLQ